MGILDDAIREHLDLKRSHGATDSELRRLEDEAFGPPSRPGEPDFPESEEASAQAGNGATAETTIVEAPSAPQAPVAPPAESPQEPEAEPEPEQEPEPFAPDDRTTVYDHTSDEEAHAEELDLA